MASISSQLQSNLRYMILIQYCVITLHSASITQLFHHVLHISTKVIIICYFVSSTVMKVTASSISKLLLLRLRDQLTLHTYLF